jgi:hypothetical protein
MRPWQQKRLVDYDRSKVITQRAMLHELPSVSRLRVKPACDDGPLLKEGTHNSRVMGRRRKLFIDSRRPPWIKWERGLSWILLFNKHDELVTPMQWKNQLAEFVPHGEFHRDGMIPDGPSACCPAASQILSVFSTQCGVPVAATNT